MNITKHNCEAFFLDYYEGNLSERQVAELFAFLKTNPDLREVFESFGAIELDAENTSTPDFSFLKKEGQADIHELAQQWMVDAVDGTISAEDKNSLDKYLVEYPARRADLAAFEQTILRADERETLDDLSSLKKETAITPENFEQYALTLVEGTISPNEKTLLESFVRVHPEFNAQLNAFKASVLKADESIVFDAKTSLKKTSVVVTTDNIEELLVDKIEGQLSAHAEAAVNAFIAANPEYRKDLELLAKTKLVADTTETFEAKNELKRGSILITENNFEQYLISASEGLLNGEELKAFNAFVAAHPKYKNTLSLYAATKLQPDMSVVYEDKEGLKRKDKGGVFWFSASVRYAAAAVLVIVLSVYFWTKFDNSEPTNLNVANNTEEKNDSKEDIPSDNNALPNTNNTELASNDSNDGNVVNHQESNSGNNTNVAVGTKNDVTPNAEHNIMVASFTPVTIIATHIPNSGNDNVSFSDALYDVVFNNDNKVLPMQAADDYITPGQLAMRWMKDKIDGTDPAPARFQDGVQGFGPGNSSPKDKNVDGMDITESAVNRVGESAANGNIAMQQRNDGTYLQLWNYEVRVAK